MEGRQYVAQYIIAIIGTAKKRYQFSQTSSLCGTLFNVKGFLLRIYSDRALTSALGFTRVPCLRIKCKLVRCNLISMTRSKLLEHVFFFFFFFFCNGAFHSSKGSATEAMIFTTWPEAPSGP